ncbi:hypothetical protein HNP84_008248 [Thermocatellispora tengchongensis]|uniref:Uncharacterized protein n=1 Tax=Thermocatellispora tengchongensis TaxID=1073253 RepID=A0A840PAS8_9ACTN|nr:hypothetical protein [Thermocatellispora tengchongensis]MBB5138494.1 hypothetical protein [Thermocatellispora tengchongensis]
MGGDRGGDVLGVAVHAAQGVGGERALELAQALTELQAMLQACCPPGDRPSGIRPPGCG